MKGKLVTIWREGVRLLTLLVGVLITSLAYSMFQIPYKIVDGGVSGISLLLNHFTDWPIGLMILIMNTPLLILGYFYLGRWSFLLRTLLVVAVFSTSLDIFSVYLPAVLSQFPVTDDILLSAIYAGIAGGVGTGLIYRAGGTMGGTSIVGRIIQQKTGAPLSQIYIYTDGAIVLAAGIIFGWEISLYALLTMFLNGMASDYVLEGPNNVRTAFIITDRPEPITAVLMAGLARGVTQWQITGGYTGETHTMLMCTVNRPQIHELKQLVAQTDKQAFVVISAAHQALGYGFKPLGR